MRWAIEVCHAGLTTPAMNQRLDSNGSVSMKVRRVPDVPFFSQKATEVSCTVVSGMKEACRSR